MSKKRKSKAGTIVAKGTIYCIQDPSMISPRAYIGRTKDEKEVRLSEHIREAHNENSRLYDTMLSRWIRKLSRRGVIPETIEVEVEYNITMSELNKSEIWHIAKYREFGIPLLNMTIGGDGNNGETRGATSDETKEKISNSLKSFYAVNVSPTLGRVLTDAEKKHLSDINTGKTATPEARKKMSENNTRSFLGKHHTEENKIAAALDRSDLTIDNVKKIKEEIYKNELTQEKIAEKFDITRSIVLHIKSGNRWKFVKIYDENNNEIDLSKINSVGNPIKLTEQDDKKIKELLLNNISYVDIAIQFKISSGLIAAMVDGRVKKGLFAEEEVKLIKSYNKHRPRKKRAALSADTKITTQTNIFTGATP